MISLSILFCLIVFKTQRQSSMHMWTTLKRCFRSKPPADDGLPHPQMRLATVDEWWRLSRDVPKFRNVSNAPLKDYGYLVIMEHIRRYKPERVLEFGHLFNPTLLEAFQHQHEMWGVDDFVSLPYLPEKQTWEDLYHRCITKNCPKARLVRAHLGKAGPGVLPENYFDVICSVSVLEELLRGDVETILKHAHRLLRPGGMLLNTIDWRINDQKHVGHIVRAHWACGFDIGVTSAKPPPFDINGLLLENPTAVMRMYQHADGEQRSYRGHWGTFFVRARRRCD